MCTPTVLIISGLVNQVTIPSPLLARYSNA
jgi:hypothetical protein